MLNQNLKKGPDGHAALENAESEKGGDLRGQGSRKVRKEKIAKAAEGVEMVLRP